MRGDFDEDEENDDDGVCHHGISLSEVCYDCEDEEAREEDDEALNDED